jgi:membrane protein DedA with SNARE-associated domain
VEALQEFVNNFTYLGIFAVLLLGSLGVPIPEEMSIIAAYWPVGGLPCPSPLR